ncbi:MAG: efflux RND transporter periplasmic adaptor subunit [Candidatus Sedimenticola sp. (ex Thyasira tokunagai)]
MKLPRLLPLLILLPALGLNGCNDTSTQEAKEQKPKRPPHLVEVVKVTKEPVSSAHERIGTLRSRRSVRIHNQEEGRITTLPFYEGDKVEKGEALVLLEDALLRAQLDKADATSRQAKLDLKRIEDLIKKRAISKDELSRATTALDIARAEQRMLDIRVGYTRITAPFSGVVTERLMEPGDIASKNSHLLTLTDPQSMVTEIHVSELLLPHMKAEDSVAVRIDALGSKRFAGRIQRIHPELDAVTRQGKVEVALDPVPTGARAGQFARVTLTSAQVERMLLPFAAVRRDNTGEFVYRLDNKGEVKRTPVHSGIRIADKIEILDGVEPGERIIKRGFLGLREGKKVKVAGSRPEAVEKTGRP